MSGLSAPSRVNDVVAVDTESVRVLYVEAMLVRDDGASGGADTGRGGRSLLRTAVGGRGWIEMFGRRCDTDLDNTVDIGGADSGSISSSCRAGKSRMSIEDIESFIPGFARCPRLLCRRDREDAIPSSLTSSSSVSLKPPFRGGEEVTLDESEGMSDKEIWEISAASSSHIRGSSMGDLSNMRRERDCECEAPEARERSDRVDACEPSLDEVGDNGAALVLATLSKVAVESRFEYTEARDIFDARRDRSAEMNSRASCSDIGEGPGTGGRGDGGGRDSGGFGLELSTDGITGGEVVSGVDSGEFGMCDGGAGKAESSSGTALRLSARRDSVAVIVDITTMEAQVAGLGTVVRGTSW